MPDTCPQTADMFTISGAITPEIVNIYERRSLGVQPQEHRAATGEESPLRTTVPRGAAAGARAPATGEESPQTGRSSALPAPVGATRKLDRRVYRAALLTGTAHVSAIRMCRLRGPCTPSTRMSSMSLVAEGPEMRVCGRAGSSRANASGRSAATWADWTTTRWKSGTRV